MDAEVSDFDYAQVVLNWRFMPQNFDNLRDEFEFVKRILGHSIANFKAGRPHLIPDEHALLIERYHQLCRITHRPCRLEDL